ncbi:hypothetical protein LTS08_004192 [Lithohypha guttulata]|nr:hypothetical protein LTS08_004192 [Lithohypha guttulata]
MAQEDTSIVVERSLTPGHNISASSESRPASSYTLHSNFADSAVDMNATTPIVSPDVFLKSQANYFAPEEHTLPVNVDQSLSDKMRRLAAVAWTLEQDDSMPVKKRRMLHGMLEQLESCLEHTTGDARGEDNVQDDVDETAQSDPTREEEADQEEEDVWIDESDLIAVRNSLSATVKAMRMRFEEQYHLHQLTAQKLEATAQRCLDQERRAEDLLRKMQQLRLENHTLGTANDQLRDKLSHVEDEAVRNEVAVKAMSSAVKGLEGWIDNANPSFQPSMAPSTSKRQRVVIRGKGRFRGRYLVDEDGNEIVADNAADAAVEHQELHEGVKAWLRGFRDVEEELKYHEPLDSPNRSPTRGRFHTADHNEADDWGDFQSGESSK